MATKVKEEKQQTKKSPTNKELDKIIADLSKKVNKNMTKRAFKDLIIGK